MRQTSFARIRRRRRCTPQIPAIADQPDRTHSRRWPASIHVSVSHVAIRIACGDALPLPRSLSALPVGRSTPARTPNVSDRSAPENRHLKSSSVSPKPCVVPPCCAAAHVEPVSDARSGPRFVQRAVATVAGRTRARAARHRAPARHRARARNGRRPACPVSSVSSGCSRRMPRGDDASDAALRRARPPASTAGTHASRGRRRAPARARTPRPRRSCARRRASRESGSRSGARRRAAPESTGTRACRR